MWTILYKTSNQCFLNNTEKLQMGEMSSTSWILLLLKSVLEVFHETAECKVQRPTFHLRHEDIFWVRKNTLTFARGPYDCLLGGEAYTAGCMSILRVLFCSFSFKPLSKQWSEEFYYNFLNKLSCVPLGNLFHVGTVQPPNTCYQDLVHANNFTLWLMPSSTPPRPWQRPWYVNTKGYLNYNVKKKFKQNKQKPNRCVRVYDVPVCRSSQHFGYVSGCNS